VRRADLLALGVLFALILVADWDRVTGPAWLGMDTATAFYPWFAFLGEQLRAGHIPTWNPHQFSGAPFAADPESGWMYLPAMLAFTALPMQAAGQGYLLFHVALAATSTYALARNLGAGPGGGLVAGTAYALSGFLQGHSLCCIAYSSVAAWLPLLLLGAERAIRLQPWRTRALWWGVGGFALSQIVSVWVGQAAYYAALILAAFIAYRTRLVSMRLLVNLAGILVFGFSLAAGGLLPRLEYNLLSNLPGGYPNADVVLASAAWSDWGFLNGWDHLLLEPGFHFLGWTPLGLALCAPLVSGRRYGVPFFAVLSIGVLILARYQPTPLHAALSILPGFERIHARSPERAMIVFYLGPALLAGLTVSSVELSSRRWFRTVVPLVAALVVWTELHNAWSAQATYALSTDGAYQLERADLETYFAPTGGARFLQARAQTDTFRYFGYAQHVYGGPWPYTLRWSDPQTTALEENNRALISGLFDIQGYNPIHLARYDELVAALNAAPQNYHHTDVLASGLNSPLLDLLNARYLIVAAVTPSDQIPPHFERTFNLVYSDKFVKVLENPSALPRAWLVHAAQQVEAGHAAQLLASGDVDPRQTALLEAPPPLLGQPDASVPDEVRIENYAADQIRLFTNSSAAGVLVLSEVYYPAWQAYVDGLPTQIYVTDHALRGIALPAGAHHVEVRYQSVALTAGLLITLVAVLSLVALSIGTFRAARRSPTS
jgi:hypothetical protein